MNNSIYVWKSDYLNSIEYAQINYDENGIHIISTLIITPEQKNKYLIDYKLVLTKEWRFISGVINVNEMGNKYTLKIVKENEKWYVNGKDELELSGCIDIDLGFSPLTNTLPIRRLNLKNNETTLLKVAWLQFPSFEIKPLNQRYTHFETNTYIYESGTNFKASIKTDDDGFVSKYEKYWLLIK